MLATLSGCGELGDPSAVRVGGLSLSVPELRRAYAELEPGARPSLASRQDRRSFARRVVGRILLVQQGDSLLAADGPDAYRDVERQHRAFLVRRLRVVLAGPVQVDSSDVVDAYERMKTRVRVESAAFARREDADSVRALVETGAPLRGPGSPDAVETGEWVTWSPVPDPVADAVAEAAVGAWIGPLAVGGGWRILHVLERAPAAPGSLEDLRARIVSGLRARHESALLDPLAVELRAAAHVVLRDDVLARLAELTRQSILAPEASEQDDDWALPRLADGEDSLEASTWTGGRLLAADYTRLLRDAPRSQRPRGALRAEVRRLVEGEVTLRVLAAEATRRGLDQDPWVQRAERRAREDAAVQRATAAIVAENHRDTASIDSLAVLLQETQPALFRRDARARVLRFDAVDLDVAQEAAARIRRAGGPDGRLAQILASDAPPDMPYHLFWFTEKELAATGAADAIFTQGPGAVAGPFRTGDMWVVYGCLGIRPSSQPTRDEVLSQVRSRVSSGPDARLVEEWTRGRIEAAGYFVDDEVLDDLAPGG